MSIEHLPSQLHIEFKSEIDIESLSSTLESTFPDSKKIEFKDDTLYAFKPNKLIEFIHIAQDGIGVIFSSEFIDSKMVKPTWSLLDPIFAKLKAEDLSDFNWQIKIVQPFKSRKERDLMAGKLSPVDGFSVNSLTLYPEADLGYYIELSMVNKHKNDYGIMLNFTFELDHIELEEVPTQLKSIVDNFIKSDSETLLRQRILGA